MKRSNTRRICMAVLLIFLLQLFTFYRDPVPVANAIVGGSWLTGWTYRKSHRIVGSTVGVQTDYQIPITVHYGDDTDSGRDVYLNASCRTDFGDIRFTSEDGELELSYWRESVVSSNYAVFWVLVESIPASPDTTLIYLYYGKADATYPSLATDLAHGEATFIFFDNFDDASIDTDKWTVQSNNRVTVEESGGRLWVWCHDTAVPTLYGGVVAKVGAVGVNHAMRTSAVFGGTEWNYAEVKVGFGNAIIPSKYVYMRERVASPGFFHYFATKDVGASSVSTSSRYTTRIYELRRTATYAKEFWNDVEKYNIVANLPTDALPTCVVGSKGEWSGQVNVQLYWTLTRKFVDPEPSNGVWGLEGEFGFPDNISVEIDNMEGCGNWVFAEERYYEFNATYMDGEGWDDLATCKIRFTDGWNTIQVSYDVSAETFSIENGSDAIILKAGTVKNVSSTALSVTFEIYFKNAILDAYNIDINMRVIDSLDEDTGWEELASNYFNIYCLGGKAVTTSTGDAGHITGGDVFDIFAGGTYTPADIFEDQFAGADFRAHWYQYEPGENDVSISSTIFYPDQPDYHSAKILAKTDDYTAYLEGDFGTQEDDFSIQLYIRATSNSDGYTQIGVWSNSSLISNLQIYFGYATDLDQIWCTDGAGYYNTTEFYSADTWYKVKIVFDLTGETYDLYLDDGLIADDMDLQNAPPKNPRYLRISSGYGTTDRTSYADVVTVWKSYAGGYGGEASVTVTYRKLQHVQMQFAVKIPNGDYILGTNVPNEFYLELIMEYCYDDVWIEGWKLRITPLGGESTGEKQWVYLWAQWYRNNVLILGKGIYAFWEGADGAKDQFSLYFDSWYNLVNASTTFGGRVSAYFYGVADISNPWMRWWTGENWGIMGQENDESMFFGDLKDGSGNTISCKTFDLMRFKVLLNRSDDYDFTVELGDFNTLDFIRTSGEMRGVATPPYNKPIMPVLSQGGVMSPIIGYFSSLANTLLVALTTGVLGFWSVLVGFLDTIFGFAGWQGGFSAILTWITNFLIWTVDGISYAVSLLTNTFLLMASWLTFAIGQFATIATGFITIFTTLQWIWTEANAGWLDLSSFVIPLLPIIPLALFIWLFSVRDIEGVIGRVKMLWDLLQTTIMFLTQIGGYAFDLVSKLINLIPVVE